MQCYWNQLKHFFVSRELPSVIPLFDWLDWLVLYSHWLNLVISLSLVASIRECEDSPLPLPPQTIPYAVLAACLVKLHVSLTQTDWKIILTVLPEQVSVSISLCMFLYINASLLLQAVFILVDFSVRLMTFHVNYFLLDLIKVRNLCYGFSVSCSPFLRLWLYVQACVSKCPFSLTVFSVDNTFIAEHKTCIESSR